MLSSFRILLVYGLLVSATAHAQTSSLKVDASNSQKLSELTPPPERYLPSVYLLQDPRIQTALAIDDQQRQLLSSMAQSLKDPKLLNRLESSAHSYPEYSQVADAQQRRQLELRTASLMELSQRLENDVLSAEQLRKLKQLRIRLCGMVYFLNAQSTADLSLTPEQRSLILNQHSDTMRECHSLSKEARNEMKSLSGTQKVEAQRMLNKRIGELERGGVAKVVGQLNESQQQKYSQLAGPPIELHRETLEMKIAFHDSPIAQPAVSK